MAVLAVVLVIVLLSGLSSSHPLTLQKTSRSEAGVGGPGGFYPDVLNIVCPGGKQQCPDGNTCCKIGSTAFGCCPKANAVCCSDKEHCCPEHYKCGGTSCQKGIENHPLLELFGRPVEEAPPLKNIPCPDGKEECPEGNTCCKISGGAYGCCPKPHALCCPDMEHCCPEDYTCGKGTCNKGLEAHPLLKLVSRLILSVKKMPPLQKVVCPNKKSECPDSNTCCLVGTSTYGCCPKPNAECCSDKKHCCPDGYTCNGTKCKLKESHHPLLQLVIKSRSIVCPGGKYQCPDSDTCCKRSDGSYGCCPVKEASCCSDMVHCCPSGYTCQSGKCVRGHSEHPLVQFVNLPVELSPPPLQGVVCPGNNMVCPNGDTCCKMEGGGYGCCPQREAVCCSDLKHCCAKGFSCDSGKCKKKNSSLPFLQIAVEDDPLENIVCPDGKSECPDGNTCCMTSSGTYGCCPKRDAVCCSDMVHCCPEGYKCDTGDGKCYNTDSSHPLLQLIGRPVHKTPPPVGNVVCPDGKSECPDGYTCCLKGDSTYGCCPKKNGVCCGDIHCCPEGYKCDSGDGKCSRDSAGHPLLQLISRPGTDVLPHVKTVFCPGSKQQCPDGSTCCSVGAGKYSCCPELNAVCCSDHKHCCPKGFTCAEGKCLAEDSHRPLLQLGAVSSSSLLVAGEL